MDESIATVLGVVDSRKQRHQLLVWKGTRLVLLLKLMLLLLMLLLFSTILSQKKELLRLLLRVEHEVGSVGVHLSLRVRRMTHESLGHSTRCGGIRSSIEEPRLVPQQAGGGGAVVVIAIVGLEVSSTKLL